MELAPKNIPLVFGGTNLFSINSFIHSVSGHLYRKPTLDESILQKANRFERPMNVPVLERFLNRFEFDDSARNWPYFFSFCLKCFFLLLSCLTTVVHASRCLWPEHAGMTILLTGAQSRSLTGSVGKAPEDSWRFVSWILFFGFVHCSCFSILNKST